MQRAKAARSFFVSWGLPALLVAAAPAATFAEVNEVFKPISPVAFGIYPAGVVIADFDADGHNDLAVAEQGQDVVQVFYGPKFAYETRASLETGHSPKEGVSGDFDGDGRLDLAVINLSGDLAVFVGAPARTFLALPRVPVADYPTTLALDDFDADGRPDLVVTSYAATFDSATITILHGRGDGSFDVMDDHRVSFLSEGVAIGDLNRDGRADLAIGGGSGPAVGILLGRGDGTFEEPLLYGSGNGVLDVQIADFDGDGIKDLAARANTGVLILRGRGDGTFESGTELPAGPVLGNIAVGDFNLDDHADLLVANSSAYDLSVFLGKGDGSFAPDLRIPLELWPDDIALGDIDGDGLTDVAVTNFLSHNVSLLLARIASADADGDGLPNGTDACTDSDGDGLGDRGFPISTCGSDNCRNSFNPDQRDHDHDGSGDACQPVLVMGGVLQDGGPDLEVSALARDPQNDPLSGTVEILQFRQEPLTIAEFGNYPDCGNFFNPFGGGDGGIVYVNRPDIGRLLGDLVELAPLEGVDCGSYYGRYVLRAGRCSQPYGYDSSILYLDYLSLPAPICVNPATGDGPGFDLTITAFDDQSVTLSREVTGHYIFPFASWPPPPFGIQFLDPEATGDILEIRITDDNTLPVHGNTNFRYGGEQYLTFINEGLPGDRDADGIPDETDSCVDNDGDGFGNPDVQGNVCPPDDCPYRADPSQSDRDGDGFGDACDLCPNAPDPDQIDTDRDGVGDACDSCPNNPDPGREDADEDGIYDSCDNCPRVFNPDQKSSDGGYSGDACKVTILIGGIREDGGEVLEAYASKKHAHGDRLYGWVEVDELSDFTIDNRGADPSLCAEQHFPGAEPGTGLAFEFEPGGGVLFDIDSRLACHDGLQDFEIARGPCSRTESAFATSLDFAGLTFPAKICARNVAFPLDLASILVDAADESGLHVSVPTGSLLIVGYDFGDDFPEVDVSSLTPGRYYQLFLWASDGFAVGSTEALFLYQGESRLVINPLPSPQSVIRAPATAECDGGRAAVVTLDGTSSGPPESGAVITRYEWFADFGLPTQTVLGTGAVLVTALPLGTNHVTLQVTGEFGETSTSTVEIEVTDTLPPVLTLSATPASLWPPNHRMVAIRAAMELSDRCDPLPSVHVLYALSSEPDDAPGGGDGSTTGDIRIEASNDGAGTVVLRAERSTDGPGRIYEFAYAASDAAGNSTTALALVTVPRDLGQGPEPIHLRLEGAGAGGAARIYWSSVPGALSYDLIAGDVRNLRADGARISLGPVRLVASPSGPSWTESSATLQTPETGQAYFYLVQYRDATGPTGFGSEDLPLPSEPDLPWPESAGGAGPGRDGPLKR